VTGYLIASRRFGKLDTHFNASYAFIGQPANVKLNNVFGAAIACVYEASEIVTYFGEVLANTAASSEGDAAPPGAVANPVAVEASGAEIVGTLGIGASIKRGRFVTLSISLDNNAAVMVRPGLVLTFK